MNKYPALYAAGLRGMDLNSNFGCVEINQCGTKPTSGDAYVAGFSLGGLFDCKRAEQQASTVWKSSRRWRGGTRHLIPRRSRTKI